CTMFQLIIACIALLIHFSFSSSGASRRLHLSLHDALPICSPELKSAFCFGYCSKRLPQPVWMITMSPSRSVTLYSLIIHTGWGKDRKSTRLNSSHDQISYAVFCLKKKNAHRAATLQSPPSM